MSRPGSWWSLVLKGLALLLLLPIRLYKLTLSRVLPPSCRFHPSCSVYAMGAIAVHGPFKGSALALKRISRCHPFNPGGLDPVPPRDGQSAAQLLTTEAPDIARRLNEPPPPHLAAFLSSPRS